MFKQVNEANKLCNCLLHTVKSKCMPLMIGWNSFFSEFLVFGILFSGFRIDNITMTFDEWSHNVHKTMVFHSQRSYPWFNQLQFHSKIKESQNRTARKYHSISRIIDLAHCSTFMIHNFTEIYLKKKNLSWLRFLFKLSSGFHKISSFNYHFTIIFKRNAKWKQFLRRNKLMRRNIKLFICFWFWFLWIAFIDIIWNWVFSETDTLYAVMCFCARFKL